jgi:hypothetical protein
MFCAVSGGSAFNGAAAVAPPHVASAASDENVRRHSETQVSGQAVLEVLAR